MMVVDDGAVFAPYLCMPMRMPVRLRPLPAFVLMLGQTGATRLGRFIGMAVVGRWGDRQHPSDQLSGGRDLHRELALHQIPEFLLR